VSGAAPVPGQAAPDFALRNQHGQQVRLSETLGVPVAVVFYPWAFSGICTGELGALRDGLAGLRGTEDRVVAVSCDPVFALRAFADQERLDFDLLSDHWPHGAVARAYGVFDEELGVARRGSFVLDVAGTVVWRTLNGIGEPRDIAAHLAALAPAA